MHTNDNQLVTECLHASIALNRGLLGALNDRALAHRMKRIAEELLQAVDVYETNEAEEEMRI